MSIGRVRRSNPELIISHWCKLIENAKLSPVQFYQRLEQVIIDRHIPELEKGEIEWREGGLLSAKRKYLRLLRERTVIDICGAPFGTGFFVSWRLGEVPLHLNILGLLFLIVCVLGLGDTLYAHNRVYFIFHPEMVAWIAGGVLVALLLFISLMRGAVAAGLCNLDAVLLHT